MEVERESGRVDDVNQVELMPVGVEEKYSDDGIVLG